jgi:hypothetical protein
MGQIASNVRQRSGRFLTAMWNQSHQSFAGRRCMVLACKEIKTLSARRSVLDPQAVLHAGEFSRFHRLTGSGQLAQISWVTEGWCSNEMKRMRHE